MFQRNKESSKWEYSLIKLQKDQINLNTVSIASESVLKCFLQIKVKQRLCACKFFRGILAAFLRLVDLIELLFINGTKVSKKVSRAACSKLTL